MNEYSTQKSKSLTEDVVYRGPRPPPQWCSGGPVFCSPGSYRPQPPTPPHTTEQHVGTQRHTPVWQWKPLSPLQHWADWWFAKRENRSPLKTEISKLHKRLRKGIYRELFQHFILLTSLWPCEEGSQSLRALPSKKRLILDMCSHVLNVTKYRIQLPYASAANNDLRFKFFKPWLIWTSIQS